MSVLVISTTLAAGTFTISRLQQANTALSKQQQQLQQQVATEMAPWALAQRASQLGMTPAPSMRFLNAGTGKLTTVSPPAKSAAGNPAGGTP